MNVPERYVRLCLQVGRHVDGFIDAYVGPGEWERATAQGEPLEPEQLRDEARSLLDDLDGADLEDERRRWLRGQLGAIECLTARLSGEEIRWSEEVERCLGVRPARTETAVLEEVHRRLDSALPGRGTVRDRFVGWEERNTVPRETIVPALELLAKVLGPRAHELAPMPAGESVHYEIVSGEPWIAYAWYEGEHRTRVQVNADLPISVCLLTTLASHEAYPGHHTERTAKDEHLYRELGRVETSVVIIPAPESLVSEGIATIALEEALGPEPFGVVADALAGAGLRFDPAEAHEFNRADTALYAAMTNAAFMLHEDGAPPTEVRDYLREWAFESEDRSARTIRFLNDPWSRAYAPTYTDGRRACGDFAGRARGNFTRLLTEQLTTTDLL